MSFISGLEHFGKSFENEFKHLFGSAPAFESTAISFISVVGPEVVGVISLFDPPVALIAQPILNKVMAALANTQVVLKAAGPAPTVISLLTSAQNNLGLLLQTAQVKDPATQAKIAGVLSGVNAGIQGIINLIQNQTGTTPTVSVTA